MRRRASPAVLALAILACGDDGDDPSVPATITVAPATAVLVSLGETVQLAASVEDQYGEPLPEAEAWVAWSSDREESASVSDAGLVTAVSNGTATVTATIASLSASATVTVRLPGGGAA